MGGGHGDDKEEKATMGERKRECLGELSESDSMIYTHIYM